MKKQLLLLISVLLTIQSMAQVNFVERLGNESPFGLPYIFSERSNPELVDIDSDGDLDLFTSGWTGGIQFHENIGTASFYNYVQRTGNDNPLFVVNPIISFGHIHFHDIDGDNDFDFAYPDTNNGVFVYFENTGSISSPSFVQRTGNDNPYNSITFTSLRRNAWTGDLNNDGFTDVINWGNIYLGNGNGFDAPIQSPASVEEVVDFDGDGDNDLVVIMANTPSTFTYMENIGDNTTMNFITVPNSTIETIANRSFSASGDGAICMEDMDNDGDVDLLFANTSANIMSVYDNMGTLTSPILSLKNDFQDFFYGVSFRGKFDYTLVDMNGDNLLDIVIPYIKWYAGPNYENVYFKNEGGLNAPKFNIQMINNNVSAGNNPFANLDLNKIFLQDFDGDSDMDLVNCASNRIFSYFENIGTATVANFQEQTTHPFSVLDNLGDGDFVDIDGDGDFDYLNGQEYYLYDSGTDTYILQSNNPINLPNARLTFVDFDNDNDNDCFATSNNQIYMYENIGNSTTSNFTLSTNNPFSGENLSFQKPKLIFGDVDIDGDLDMFVMDSIQKVTPLSVGYYYLRYFENQTIYTNTQTPETASIQNLTITPNPNNGTFMIDVPKSLQQEKFSLQIFDLTGRMIVQRQYQNADDNLMINDLKQYANGLYIVTLQSETERYQAKILKQ